MPKSWSVIDFILVFLGGLLGASVAVGIGYLVGGDEATIVLGLVGQSGGSLLVIWLLSRRKDNPDLGFSIAGPDILYVGVGFLLQILLSYLLSPLARLLIPEGEQAQELANALAELEGSAVRWTAFLVAVLLAPVTEELMFRGVLIKAMPRARNWVVIVVTTLVFTAFHIPDLASSNFLAKAAVVLPNLFIVGVVLAWVTLKTKRLGPAIFIHSGYNMVAAIFLLLPDEVLDSLG